jgi:hypothetical protein
LKLSRIANHRSAIFHALAAFARLAAAENRQAEATRLLGASDSLREALSMVLPPVEQAVRDRMAASVRDALGRAVFKIAWEEGRALTLERAMEYALQNG